ncbi:hypothetical protein C0991_010734 [Blastosporella zonata]|nr:hypothetical protein C0991_010734 [Blastosporella zonata]
MLPEAVHSLTILRSFASSAASHRSNLPMVAHPVPRHHAKRQDDPVAAPTTIEGVVGTTTASNIATTQAALAIDSTAPARSQSAPNLGITSTPVTTSEASSTQAPASSTPSTSAAAASSSPISISTVVGACVGAFIGAIALIVLSLWFYRRYSRSLKERARSRRAPGPARNANGEQSRRRSHLEPWNKLEEGDDKWEGMYQTKEIDAVAPMEKLTMFKKRSPSVRTAYTHKSDEPVTFEAHSFAQYHPSLAQELASNEKLDELPIARQFLGRVDAGPAISWDGETVRDSDYSRGTMSPVPNMAIPTPPATTSQLHHWESAEVLHYQEPDPYSANAHNLLVGERRKSTGNPFFSAHGSDSNPHPRPRSNSTRSRASSTRSRSNSTATARPDPEPPIPKVDKGKGRAIQPFDYDDDDNDPFADRKLPTFPRPFASHSHNPSGSLSSVSSNDRALQSLIAALDVSAEEAQERLRVASMQPSFVSATSTYTSGGEEEDVTGSFPLPPLVAGHQYH